MIFFPREQQKIGVKYYDDFLKKIPRDEVRALLDKSVLP
jgi:hypothetical protein